MLIDCTEANTEKVPNLPERWILFHQMKLRGGGRVGITELASGYVRFLHFLEKVNKLELWLWLI